MAKEKEVAKTEANLPAIIDTFNFLAISDLTDLQANFGTSKVSPNDLERVSVPAGKGTTWELTGVDGEVESLKELTGILIHWKEIRAYWEAEYTGEQVPPDCASKDTITGIGNPGGVCATCPKSQFGSGKNGAQACSLKRVLYLMRPGMLLPIVVTVPPTSIKGVRKFFMSLTSQGLRFDSVVLALKIEKDKNKGGIEYSKVKLGVVQKIDKETAAKIKAYADQIRSVMEEAALNNPE